MQNFNAHWFAKWMKYVKYGEKDIKELVLYREVYVGKKWAWKETFLIWNGILSITGRPRKDLKRRKLIEVLKVKKSGASNSNVERLTDETLSFISKQKFTK